MIFSHCNSRVLSLLTFLLPGNVPAVAELMTGTITRNKTLTGSNTVQGKVTVPAGVVLTITPGTTLLMQAAAEFEVRGQLLADGTAAAPILFTREVTAARWRRIMFIRATESRMTYCTFEYANSAGTHLDYYDNDCYAATPSPARTYHEAIVLLASHVDFAAILGTPLSQEYMSNLPVHHHHHHHQRVWFHSARHSNDLPRRFGDGQSPTQKHYHQ